MATIFNPLSGEATLTEFVGTPGLTVTLTAPVVAPPTTPPAEGEVVDTITYTYELVSVTCVDQFIPEDLVITLGTTSFTIASSFPDMFDRTLKYLVFDKDNVGVPNNEFMKTYLQVKRFRDLPELFTGLYQYVPPSVQSRQVPFTVVYDETMISSLSGSSTTRVTDTWTFTINENWQLALTYLKYYAKQGTNSKQAIAKYPELSL